MLDASFGCKRSKVACWRGDNGHATTHEVNHERREAIEFALQCAIDCLNPVIEFGLQDHSGRD